MRRFSFILFCCIAFTISNAQSHYQGQHEGKFAVKDMLNPALMAFNLKDIKLLDSRFRQNMQRDQQWLLSIDVNRLMHSFRTNAGIYSGNEGGYFTVKKLGGWESLDCELRGHSTGHILSALALMYASTSDTVYKRKGDSLVTGLAEVQIVLNQNGYLSAYPQELINRNISGQRVWAPWYTLHKIFAGLIDQYLYADNRQALDIATKMGDWAFEKLQGVEAAERTKMLRNEFGGVNETFYNLYAITGKENYKWLGDFFYHNETLDPLIKNQDILDTKHANTYIPKLLGLTRLYEIEGKGNADSVATFFWQTVVNHHSFVTGSNSDKEHFFKPDQQTKHLTGYTGESCNVYNMLKLTRHLYTHSGDIRYADYYERALFNHILGQQDPETGMISYFLPMMGGAHKVYSTPENSFWCCVGSGFENHAKYGEAIYYHSKDDVYINLFIPSTLRWNEKGLRLKQETSFPQNGNIKLTIDSVASNEFTLSLRYPSWSGIATVKVNGKTIKLNAKPGSYIDLKRKWKAGDIVEVNFPMTLEMIPASDDSSKFSFAYGPIVLAGEMGKEGFVGTQPFSNTAQYNDYYTYDYKVPSNIVSSLHVEPQLLGKYIKPADSSNISFKLEKENITLRPLYDIHQQRYVVYWNLGNR